MATAILNGTLVDDGGLVCEVSFEYGLTPAYGLTTPWRPGYWAGMTFQARIYNLAGGVLIYFRAAARNALGTTYGTAMTFTTIAREPIVVTDPATAISNMGATLNGTLIDDMTAPCMVRFKYGGSSALGMETPRAVAGVVSGGTFSITIVGLSPGRPCFFQAVADNRYGRGYGTVMSFSTLSDMGPRTGFPMEYALLLEEG